MDILFNFGEHYYEASNSKIFFDLFITFLSAGLGFIVAIQINKIFEIKNLRKQKEQEEKLDLMHLEYFSQLIDSVTKSYTKQAENYFDLAKRTREQPFEILIGNLQATNDLKRLKEQDSKELRNAYYKISKKTPDCIKNYRQALGWIDFLLLYFKSLTNQCQKHIKYHHEDQLFIRNNFEEIAIQIGIKLKNLQKKNIKSDTDNQEIKYLKSHFSNFRELIDQPPINFEQLYTKFFEPLHNTILIQMSDDNFADSLFQKVKQSMNRYSNMKFNAEMFANDMIMVKESVIEPLDFLKSFNEEMNEKILADRE